VGGGERFDELIKSVVVYLKDGVKKGEYHIGEKELIVNDDSIRYKDPSVEIGASVWGKMLFVKHKDVIEKFEELHGSVVRMKIDIDDVYVYFDFDSEYPRVKLKSVLYGELGYYIRDIKKIKQLLIEVLKLLPEFKEKIDQFLREYKEELSKIYKVIHEYLSK